MVVPAARPAAKETGYVPAFVGSVVGGVIGGAVATLPATLFLIAALHQAGASNPNEPLGQAVADTIVKAFGAAILAGLLFLLGVVLGLWMGPVLGAFVALRSRAQALVGLTTGIMVLFQAVVTVALFLLLIAAGAAINNPAVVTVVLAILVVIDLTLPALLARGVARLIRLRHL